MSIVTVSSKYQVVIPKDVREALGVKPGARFEMIGLQDRIELIPIGSVKKLKGFLKGMDTTLERDDDQQ